MKTKISTGKIDDESKLKGKVPSIDDMEEGSDKEEASESPDEEAKEVKEGEAPDKDDTSGKGGVNTDHIKQAVKEVQMEKDLQYTIDHKTKEELQCLIKMAQAKLDSGDFKSSSKDSSLASPSKY